jgi:8-oxo-dGTP pyrophosphatase MutT (NUDIX family)
VNRSVTGITSEYADRLRAVLGRRAPATVDAVDARHASVAVVVTSEAEPALLFVKRQERIGDPWSGHMAFPGGFQSAGETPIETAQREAEEETGLPLARTGTCVGSLDDVFPRSVHLPRVIVTPVVFVVEGRPVVEALAEVDQAVWLPAAAVFAPANRRPLELDLPLGRQTFDSIVVGPFTIWGLTERVLAQLANII